MFAAPMPVQPYPPATFVSPPAPMAWAGQPAQPFAAPLRPAPMQPSVLPAPRFRAQSPDEPVSAAPRTVALRMPSPEELGLSPRAAGGVEWDAAHRRLDRLGALCIHREKLPQGGFRFTCLLPTGQADRTHRVEATAATEGEAVRLVLEKAEEWAGARR